MCSVREKKILYLQKELDKKRSSVYNERCPICRNRTDGIVEIDISFIEDKIEKFINSLDLNKTEKLKMENSKFAFLETIVSKHKEE